MQVEEKSFQRYENNLFERSVEQVAFSCGRRGTTKWWMRSEFGC